MLFNKLKLICVYTYSEAAQATSAAPTFFRPAKISPRSLESDYVDAGVGGYNNPVRQIIAEAKRIFGKSSQIACVLSIGTGQPLVTNVRQSNPIERYFPTATAQVLNAIATESEMKAEEVSEQYRKSGGVYKRLNDLSNGSVLAMYAYTTKST